MNRTLILMRHAKSCWDDPGLDDHDRPLNGRGRRSARALGRWLRDRGWRPDQVLSSDSRRTRETFAGLGLELRPVFVRRLYLAGPAQIRDTLRTATGRVVLVLGHNPGIRDFAHRIVQQPPAHPRFDDYPTGATLVVRFDLDDWAALDAARGAAVDFVVPRALRRD